MCCVVDDVACLFYLFACLLTYLCTILLSKAKIIYVKYILILHSYQRSYYKTHRTKLSILYVFMYFYIQLKYSE